MGVLKMTCSFRKILWSLIFLGVVYIIVIQYLETRNLKNEIRKIASQEKHIETEKILKIFSSAMKEGMGCGKTSIPKNSTVEKGFFHVLKSSNGTFRLLSAFYDARQFHVQRNQSGIRIIALIDVVEPTIQTFCQLWFDDIDGPIISHVHEYRYLFLKAWGVNKKGSNQYRLSCRNPLASVGRIPKSVSLVEKPCDNASNLLEIVYNLPQNNVKKQLAICTQPYVIKDDISMIVIEWVEAWFALGIEKIYLNVIQVPPALKKTLDFYEFAGKMEVRVFPEPLENYWSMPNQMVALNDCLLRHMHEYNFILAVDIDEIIVPSTDKDNNLVEFIDRMIDKINVEKKQPAEHIYDAYAAANSFFFLDNNHKDEIQPEVPENLHFLQKIYRSIRYPGHGPKSFHHTETVDVMHNHHPLFCLQDKGDGCSVATFDYADAKLHHYRVTCSLVGSMLSVDMCNDFTTNTTRDDSLWFWKDKITANFFKTLDDMETRRLEIGTA